MGYYIRILSPIKENVTLEIIYNCLRNKKINFSIEHDLESKKLNNKNWKQTIFFYSKNKQPILLNRDIANQKGNLVKEEVKEFLDEIKNLPVTKKKKEIESRLKRTKQIFSFQIPTSDIDDSGWNLVDTIIDILVEKSKGFVQVDREGFYIDKKLVLKIK